jgi:hypothetical protein
MPMATSVSAKVQTVLCGIALCGATTSAETNAEDEIPDPEFLEYLGMWDESDEDWLLLKEDAQANNEERSDPVPEGEESAENKDAS